MPEETEPQERPPSFSAPLLAALRQGAKELAQVLPAFPESVRVVEEPGMMGVPTQYAVNNQMGIGRDFDNMLDGYAARGQDREQSQEKEMER
ncbi:MAG: hypothetical protein KF774_15685 [Planctomyces sp.]|nr:hypothetical protein [Planctomyces sp.]